MHASQSPSAGRLWLTLGGLVSSLLIWFGSSPVASRGAGAGTFCPPLPAATGMLIDVSNEADLRTQATSAPAGATLRLQSGVYPMGSYLHITVPGLTIRGETGDRDDVVLDFGGMRGGYFGILLDADDVTLADLTVREATDHGVSVQAADRPLLYNLHIENIGDQLVKVNPGGDGSQDGVLACSRLEYTAAPPDDYTNGISAHEAHDWVVRDNQWHNIRGPEGPTGPTILFWSGSSGTIVERNLIVDSYRGIAFGNPSHTGIDHYGGIVRNNMIVFSKPHDVAIEMTRADGWLVAHNTALLLNPVQDLTWGMEARYPESQGVYAYNLTNMTIWATRDGAAGVDTGNITNAQAPWFVDAPNADLHLVAGASTPMDAGLPLPEVPSDFDGNPRPAEAPTDVGADEFEVLTLDVHVYLPMLPR